MKRTKKRRRNSAVHKTRFSTKAKAGNYANKREQLGYRVHSITIEGSKYVVTWSKAKTNPRKKTTRRKARRKNAGPDSWRKTVKAIKKKRRAGGMTDWNFPSRMKQVWKESGRKPGGAAARNRKAKKNPAAPRKAKTGTWYKGPRGVKVRVRRVRGKFVVDLKGR